MKYFVQVKFKDLKNLKFNLTPINFQKIANWPLKFFKFDPKFLKFTN